MNKTKIIMGIALAALCLTLLVHTQIAGAESGQSCSTPTSQAFSIIGVNWGNSSHVIAAGPGENDVPLRLTIESFVNECPLISVEGLLQLRGGFENFNGSSTSAVYLPIEQPFSTFNMTFYLNINKNLTAGLNKTYAFPFYISWTYNNQTIKTTQVYTVQVPLYGSPQLSYDVRNRQLVAGELNNLTIAVTNTGSGTAQDLYSSVAYSSSFNPVGQPKPIASIAPNTTENMTVQVYVSPSLAGQSVPLTLDSHYINPYGYNTSTDTTLDLYAISASQGTLSLSTSTPEIVAGKVQNVSIILGNHGSSAIDNVSLLLEPQSPLSLIGAETYINLPEILPGKNATIPIELYAASSSSPVSNLDVQLSYDGQSEGSARVLSFLTPGYVNITQVSITLLPASPTPGSIFSLTSTIDNLGSTTAAAATVMVHPPQGLSMIGSNTTFIGGISTDTPTAFTLSFRVSPTAAQKTYTIPVYLTYYNNLNQKLNGTFYYDVNVGSAGGLVGGNYVSGSNGNFTTSGFRHGSGISAADLVGIILAIVVIAGAAYYLLKRRKKVHKK